MTVNLSGRKFSIQFPTTGIVVDGKPLRGHQMSMSYNLFVVEGDKTYGFGTVSNIPDALATCVRMADILNEGKLSLDKLPKFN